MDTSDFSDFSRERRYHIGLAAKICNQKTNRFKDIKKSPTLTKNTDISKFKDSTNNWIGHFDLSQAYYAYNQYLWSEYSEKTEVIEVHHM